MVNRDKIHKDLIGELRGQIKGSTGGRMTASEEESTTGPGGNNADTHSPPHDDPDGDEYGGKADGRHAEPDGDEPPDSDSDTDDEVRETMKCTGCGSDVGSKFCGECGTPRGGGEEAEAEFE